MKILKHRSRQHPILLELSEIKKKIEDNFKELLKSTKVNKSDKWTEVYDVLGYIKSKQSQDGNGFSNELFQLKNIEKDLKNSMLLLFNKIKENLCLPNALRDALISAIPKNRKSAIKF